MTRSFDNYTCERDVRSLGSYNTQVSGIMCMGHSDGWAVALWGQVLWTLQVQWDSEWALVLGSTLIAALVPPLVFPVPSAFHACWTGLIAEQEEKPSELGIQCEMELLWNCLLPGKTSSIFFPLSLLTLRLPRKRSVTLFCYVFLS